MLYASGDISFNPPLLATCTLRTSAFPSRTKVSYEEWTAWHVADAERKIPSQGGGKIYRLSTSNGRGVHKRRVQKICCPAA